MQKALPAFFVTIALTAGSAGAAMAQSAATPGTPSPAQAGADPSMAKPGGSTQPALAAPPPVQNPESTTGLAPAEQPVNNTKPNVAGQVVPSSHLTAAHDASIAQHDQQPIITHTFNFTADQKRAIVDALSQQAPEPGNHMPGKDMPGKDLQIAESMVLPRWVKLSPVPEGVASQMPWVKPYLYAKIGNKIALVEPNHRYVAAVIE